MALRTLLCDLLQCEYPIMNAPMRDLSGPHLAAAVSNAGGFGVIQKQYDTPALFREHLKETKALTERPFGASFLLTFPYEELLQVRGFCLLY
jgi:enoyl-[acyl-carrier protein] reductase II